MKSSPKINIKLIQGLTLLSQTEFNEFVNFSTSKYFSGQRNYAKTLELLKKLHKSGFQNYNNKSLMDHLMKELNLNRNTLLNRMSELYKIYEMFVVIRQLKYLPAERNKILMEYYSERSSFKLFDYVHNISAESLKKEKISLYRMRYELMLHDQASTKFFRSGKNKLFNEQYSLKTEFSVYLFILELLKDSIEILQQKFMGNKLYTEIPKLVLDDFPFDGFFEYLKKINPGYYHLTRIIYNMYLSFCDYSDIGHFKSALKIHKKIKSSLNDSDNEYLYILLITYCINQTHFNKPVFYEYLFGIIQDKLNDGYFSELKENNFPVNNFRDYVIIGLKSGNTEWTRSFIKDYSPYLPLEFRQDNILIALGMIANNEGKFEEVLKILKKVKKKNYIHYLDSTFYKLRAYYELKYYDDAYIEIEKIKKYLKSNKSIPVIFVKNYSLSLKVNEILLKYVEGKIDIIDFKLDIKKSCFGAKNNWAMDEVDKILKNSS